MTQQLPTVTVFHKQELPACFSYWFLPSGKDSFGVWHITPGRMIAFVIG